MSAPNAPKLLLYSKARPQILPGDILLYRPTRWNEPLNKLIARCGPRDDLRRWQRYAHAGMAERVRRIVLLLEMSQGQPGHAVTLSSQVKAYPGQYDVYRVKSPFDAGDAVAAMLRYTGTPYGRLALWYTALRHCPLVSALIPPPTDDTLSWAAPHCSQAVSFACRRGDRDPRPEHADIATHPNHLAMPGFSKYQFTLVP